MIIDDQAMVKKKTHTIHRAYTYSMFDYSYRCICLTPPGMPWNLCCETSKNGNKSD
jgi:hypothetical protein